MKVLKRYRVITFTGWLVVFIGAISLPIGWKYGQPHGLIDIALSVLTIVAGIMAIQQAVWGLESFLGVPFADAEHELPDKPPAITEIELLMREINEGGWWEANGGIKKLEEIAVRYGLEKNSTGVETLPGNQ
jgi:hypothetical protein